IAGPWPMLIDEPSARFDTERNLFPTDTHLGAAPGRWMCTPASREARCGHTCGSPLTKVGAGESSPNGRGGRFLFFAEPLPPACGHLGAGATGGQAGQTV